MHFLKQRHTLFTDAIEPIPLPGSAFTEVACESGLWNCGMQVTLEEFCLRSDIPKAFALFEEISWRCSGATADIVDPTGRGNTGNGEHMIEDGGNIALQLYIIPGMYCTANK